MKKIKFFNSKNEVVEHNLDVDDFKTSKVNEFINLNKVEKIMIDSDSTIKDIKLSNIVISSFVAERTTLDKLLFESCVIGKINISSDFSAVDMIENQYMTDTNIYENKLSLEFYACVVKRMTLTSVLFSSLTICRTIFFPHNVSIFYNQFNNCSIYESDMNNSMIHLNLFLNSNFLRETNFSGSSIRDNSFYEDDVFYGCNFLNVKFLGNLRMTTFEDTSRITDLSASKLFENCIFTNKLVPSEGSFIGWKKAYNIQRVLFDKQYEKEEALLVKLLVTKDSLRTNSTSFKCRCSRAKVLAITNLDGTRNYDKAYSAHNPDFTYVVGKHVKVSCFDNENINECTKGIHFFIDKQMAINY